MLQRGTAGVERLGRTAVGGLLVALAAATGASGCTQILFDGTSARVDGAVQQDSTASDIADTTQVDTQDLPDVTDDAGSTTDVAEDVGISDSEVADGPDADGLIAGDGNVAELLGPWNFASDSDLAGWQVFVPLGVECSISRDAELDSLKVTFTSDGCAVGRFTAVADIHDYRVKVRVRGESIEVEPNRFNFFSEAAGSLASDSARQIVSDWQESSFLIDAPGAPSRYDPTKVSRYGITFQGPGGTAWLDYVRLAREAIKRPLPSYEFDDSVGELGIGPTTVSDSSVKVSAGHAIVRATFDAEDTFDFGGITEVDLSRALSMRTRIHIVGDAKVELFMMTGAGWSWFQAEAPADADLHEWTEFSWDLRLVRDLNYVRRWGFRVSKALGTVELHVDWIHFEDAPLATSDAGVDAGMDASHDGDAVSGTDSGGDAGVVTDAGL